MSTTTELGAIILLTNPEGGDNVWTAKQSDLGNHAPRVGDPRTSKCFDWSFEIVTVSGCVDTDTFGVTLTVSVLGINIGTISGNLQDGVGVRIDLILVKGEIKFYLKNGNELWVHLGLDVKFDGSYNGDYKIFSW